MFVCFTFLDGATVCHVTDAYTVNAVVETHVTLTPSGVSLQNLSPVNSLICKAFEKQTDNGITCLYYLKGFHAVGPKRQQNDRNESALLKLKQHQNF